MSKYSNAILRLDQRHDEEGIMATIDVDGHGAIAEVVVRMEGQTEDDPDLVNFARTLVSRYNGFPKLVAGEGQYHVDLNDLRRAYQRQLEANFKFHDANLRRAQAAHAETRKLCTWACCGAITLAGMLSMMIYVYVM